MIEFHYKVPFVMDKESYYSDWISRIVESERKNLGELAYIFCDDAYLLRINQEYLQHDTYTDIITFDYSEGNLVSGDVFISVDRLRENAVEFAVPLENELLRVMAHGLLHLCGYGDKVEEEKALMRKKEDEKIAMFHVEQ